MKRIYSRISARGAHLVFVVWLLNRMLRVALAGYAAAEPLLQFTLMKLWRLTVSVIASLLRWEAVQLGVTAQIPGSLDSRR